MILINSQFEGRKGDHKMKKRHNYDTKLKTMQNCVDIRGIKEDGDNRKGISEVAKATNTRGITPSVHKI